MIALMLQTREIVVGSSFTLPLLELMSDLPHIISDLCAVSEWRCEGGQCIDQERSSERCLEAIWKVFGSCLKGFWKVSRDCLDVESWDKAS